ncbi:hypothetical protein Nmel_009499 [Mimus melanotis]
MPPCPLSPGVASEGGKERLLVVRSRINEPRSLLGLMERCMCTCAFTYACVCWAEGNGMWRCT